jgi:hypothetical protein
VIVVGAARICCRAAERRNGLRIKDVTRRALAAEFTGAAPVIIEYSSMREAGRRGVDGPHGYGVGWRPICRNVMSLCVSESCWPRDNRPEAGPRAAVREESE